MAEKKATLAESVTDKDMELKPGLTVRVYQKIKEFMINAIGNIKPIFDKLYRSDWLGKIRYRLYKP